VSLYLPSWSRVPHALVLSVLIARSDVVSRVAHNSIKQVTASAASAIPLSIRKRWCTFATNATTAATRAAAWSAAIPV
jgi:hypothetical protein